MNERNEKIKNKGFEDFIKEDSTLLEKVNATSLQILEMTVKTYNILLRHGIKNLNDLSSVTTSEIMKWRNLGRKSLEEIINLMNEYNIKFADQ